MRSSAEMGQKLPGDACRGGGRVYLGLKGALVWSACTFLTQSFFT